MKKRPWCVTALPKSAARSRVSSTVPAAPYLDRVRVLPFLTYSWFPANRFENDLCIVISTSYQWFTPGSVFISSEYTTDMEKNKNKYIRWKALCLWCILACSSCSGTEIAVSCSKRQIMGSDSGMSPKLLSFLSDRVEMDSAVARKMLDWVIPWLKRDSYWFWELSTWQLLIERKRTGL